MASDTGPVEGLEPDATAETAPAESNWGPTRLSAGLVVALVAAVVAVFVGRTGLVAPVVLAVAGATLLAVALWAVGRERYRFPAMVLANLALVPVGVCLLAAVASAVLLQYGSVFPVETQAQIVAPALRIVVTAVAVGFLSLATLGALAAVGDVVDTDGLRACHGQALRAALPPLVGALGFGGLAVLSSPEFGPTFDPLAVVSDVLDVVFRVLLAPEASDVVFGPFLLLVGLAFVGVSRLLRALPLEEFATAREGTEEPETEAAAAARTLVRLDRPANLTGALFVLVGVAVTVAGALLGPRGLLAMLGGVAVLLRPLAATPVLRTLLFGFVLLAAVVVLVVRLLRRVARTSTGDLLVGYVPYAVGVGVVFVAFTVHGPVLETGIPAVAANLGGFDEIFTGLATGVVELYGGGVVLSAVVAFAGLLAGTSVALVRTAAEFGLVPERGGGAALAATGPLVASGLAAAVTGDLVLALVGVTCALLARDVGTYGTVLGAELGRRAPSRRGELVHAVGAGLVAVVGVGLAAAAARLASGTALALPIPVAGPLAAAVLALVLLVLVLR